MNGGEWLRVVVVSGNKRHSIMYNRTRQCLNEESLSVRLVALLVCSVLLCGRSLMGTLLYKKRRCAVLEIDTQCTPFVMRRPPTTTTTTTGIHIIKRRLLFPGKTDPVCHSAEQQPKVTYRLGKEEGFVVYR